MSLVKLVSAGLIASHRDAVVRRIVAVEIAGQPERWATFGKRPPRECAFGKAVFCQDPNPGFAQIATDPIGAASIQ
jgi:hypothetical protein